MQEMSKGKEVMHSLETTVFSKPTSPLTRSSARNKSSKTKGKLAASEKTPTSPTEGEKA